MTLRELARRAREDLDMVQDRDPSVHSRSEALVHPGVLAIWSYRLAHHLHVSGHRLAARVVSNVARVLSGSIEIHPGAEIGARFFIDHGAGVVIGETAVIGNDVTLFHQVTLGSVGWWHNQSAGTRRHPLVQDGVVIGVNASVLGPVTIGAGSVIGAHTLTVRDVVPNAHVVARAAEAAASVVIRRLIPLPRTVATRRDPALAGLAVFPTW